MKKSKPRTIKEKNPPIFFFRLILSTIVISLVVFFVSNPKIDRSSVQITNLADLIVRPIKIREIEPPVLSSYSAVVYDPLSKSLLFEKNSRDKVLIASTTKIATALVALANYKLSDILTVKNINVSGQKMGLAWGEKISVENLLYGLLVYSANDAAEVLANDFPEGRVRFIEKMNRLKDDLGLKDTHFSNPTGLDETGHYSTAYDLALLGQVAMENPTFAKIVSTKQITVESEDGKIKHKLVNLNQLLETVPGIMGIKTGWTERAGENLVTEIERDGSRLIIVVMDSQDRFGDTRKLIDWVYNSFEWRKVSHSP